MRVNHFFSRGRVVVFILIPRDLKWGPTKTHTHTHRQSGFDRIIWICKWTSFFLPLFNRRSGDSLEVVWSVSHALTSLFFCLSYLRRRRLGLVLVVVVLLFFLFHSSSPIALIQRSLSELLLLMLISMRDSTHKHTHTHTHTEREEGESGE